MRGAGRLAARYNEAGGSGRQKGAQFQFRQSPPITQIPLGRGWPQTGPERVKTSKMDKIAGLREILAADPGNSFARYGIAMELARQGDTAAAMAEFDTLLTNDPEYTAGYFMAAQTLAASGRTTEAIARLKEGIASGTRSGNRHAVSEMQAMLDELDR
jgi:tetratricopeptide (TPR) repeat protein